MTDIRTGGDVDVFIPNYDDKSCAFIYNNVGDMLRTNSRKLPLMNSSDVLSSEEAICRDASSAYRRAYNVELSRLDLGAYNATCSALTPEPARRELGLDANHTMVESK